MDSYPQVFGQAFPFVLVDDVDAHRFLASFLGQDIEIIVREGGHDLTCFEFPGRNRESVQILMDRFVGKTKPLHSTGFASGWINPRIKPPFRRGAEE